MLFLGFPNALLDGISRRCEEREFLGRFYTKEDPQETGEKKGEEEEEEEEEEKEDHPTRLKIKSVEW